MALSFSNPIDKVNISYGPAAVYMADAGALDATDYSFGTIPFSSDYEISINANYKNEILSRFSNVGWCHKGPKLYVISEEVEVLDNEDIAKATHRFEVSAEFVILNLIKDRLNQLLAAVSGKTKVDILFDRIHGVQTLYLKNVLLNAELKWENQFDEVDKFRIYTHKKTKNLSSVTGKIFWIPQGSGGQL